MNTILIIIVIIILLIFIFALGGLNYYFISKNNTNAVQQTVKSFSAKIDPTTGNPTGFKGQLSCPAGTSINIISAFYDIDDPYATCSSNISQVNPLLAFMCNPNVSSPGVCEVGKNQCPSGTKCVSGHCQLVQSSGSCPANTSPVTYNGETYCVNTDICGTTGIPNQVCGGNTTGGSGQCAIRDASASVSKKCNGQNNCDDLSVNDFGDAPCNFSAPVGGCFTMGSNGPIWGGTSGRPSSGYCALPYGPGWGGGAPDYGSNSDSPSGNLGYTMHGIYSCSAN